jgi:hypothetical protein
MSLRGVEQRSNLIFPKTQDCFAVARKYNKIRTFYIFIWKTAKQEILCQILQKRMKEYALIQIANTTIM